MITPRKPPGKPDDGLRAIIRRNLNGWHWCTVETGGTQSGVPDLEGCKEGIAAWVECKSTSGWAVRMRPFQIGWHLQRARVGGRSFVAIRRRCPAGPRRGRAVDELWLVAGCHAGVLSEKGLREVPVLGIWPDGPESWKWGQVDALLRSGK